MVDWTSRADLIAVWIYDTGPRREQGILFPSNFIDLSLTLIARQQEDKLPFMDELCAVLNQGPPEHLPCADPSPIARDW